MPMPNALRIVIIEDVSTVMRGGEEVHYVERRYQLAFGGRVICPELNDKNQLEVLFGMFMFAVTDHPEVVSFLFWFGFTSHPLSRMLSFPVPYMPSNNVMHWRGMADRSGHCLFGFLAYIMQLV